MNDIEQYFNDKSNRRKFTERISNVSLFWMSMLAFQRVAGIFKIHAGLPLPFTTVIGTSFIASSACLTSRYAPVFTSQLWGDDMKSVKKPRELLQNSCLNLVCFALLERNLFKTALPSSVIARGAYARRLASIKATSDVATSAQRARIQIFGKVFGCHQCGSRQAAMMKFREGFIADHMPPTLFISRKLKTWWGKAVHNFFPLTQRLYPQCTKCYSKQGSKVKAGVDSMIYHSRLRLVHLSPIVADFLLATPWISNTSAPIARPFSKLLDSLDKFLSG
jgi:hypothetical protein